ncbi:Spermidine/spermine N(1)-acetyltransferase [Cytospora mali]|nr:Spermidine/spermine N(1)-acetyltransferase [Valsa mali var. pyri (nom. inval.)]
MGQGQDAVIERAGPSDSAAIRQMVISAYAKYVPRMGGQEPAPMKADYHAIVTSQSQDVFVLRRLIDGEVVGALLLSDPGDNSIEVDNIVVGSSAQGRGYGRLLMDYAEDVARERSRSALVLYTNEKMTENIALYAKMGFVEMCRREEDGYKRVYFQKDLVSTDPS